MGPALVQLVRRNIPRWRDLCNLQQCARAPKPNGDWPEMLLTMLNSYLHHALVYALFGFAWYWASKHYRSHWHNYVANAYRHRSLYRFEMLRREIPNQDDGGAG
jgi:hypothetical protein